MYRPFEDDSLLDSRRFARHIPLRRWRQWPPAMPVLNWSQPAYSPIESGEPRLYEDELFELCRILECKPEELLENLNLQRLENNYAYAAYIQHINSEQGLLEQNHTFPEKMQQRNEDFLKDLTRQLIQVITDLSRNS